MIEIDEISNLVTVDCELRLFEVEEELKQKHFTLGYFVPPDNSLRFEEALSRGAPNLYGQFYGELSDLCVSLELHSRNLESLKTFPAPRQAAGPDWKNFILGAGDSLGFVNGATLKIFPLPNHFLYLAVGLAHDIASHPLEQELIRDELHPWVFGRFGNMQVPPALRLPQSPLTLLCAWAGTKDAMDARKRRIEEILDERYVWHWVEGKNHQKSAHRILHDRYPHHPWGGPRHAPKDENKMKLEKEILKVLRGRSH